MTQTNTITRAADYIRQRNGIIRASEAIRSGIHPRTLYAMRDEGILESMAPGLYKLADMDLTDPGLTTIAKSIPNGVLCLVSALDYHGITTQIPTSISIAVPAGSEKPRLSYPPIDVHWYNPSSYRAGISNETVDGIALKVYNPEKTLADCFKFRNRIGIDVAIEALKLYRERMHIDIPAIMKYSRICRVNKVIRPYLEMLE